MSYILHSSDGHNENLQLRSIHPYLTKLRIYCAQSFKLRSTANSYISIIACWVCDFHYGRSWFFSHKVINLLTGRMQGSQQKNGSEYAVGQSHIFIIGEATGTAQTAWNTPLIGNLLCVDNPDYFTAAAMRGLRSVVGKHEICMTSEELQATCKHTEKIVSFKKQQQSSIPLIQLEIYSNSVLLKGIKMMSSWGHWSVKMFDGTKERLCSRAHDVHNLHLLIQYTS